MLWYICIRQIKLNRHTFVKLDCYYLTPIHTTSSSLSELQPSTAWSLTDQIYTLCLMFPVCKINFSISNLKSSCKLLISDHILANHILFDSLICYNYNYRSLKWNILSRINWRWLNFYDFVYSHQVNVLILICHINL